MQSLNELRIRTNKASVNLLFSDVEIALTFLDIADTTQSEENRSRRREEALRAYTSIVTSLPRVDLTEQEDGLLQAKLRTVRYRLMKKAA